MDGVAIILPEAELLRPEEVAAYLRCCTQTVKKMVQDGRLTGGKVGHRWLVRRDSVVALVEGRGAKSKERLAPRKGGHRD